MRNKKKIAQGWQKKKRTFAKYSALGFMPIESLEPAEVAGLVRFFERQRQRHRASGQSFAVMGCEYERRNRNRSKGQDGTAKFTMNQYTSDGAGWRPTKILRQLQCPQANLARALRQLFLHLGIKSAFGRSTGRKKRRLLP